MVMVRDPQMPARIRFVVTPQESVVDPIARRMAREGAGDRSERMQGEREIADEQAGQAARMCEAVNAAFGDGVRGARIRLECEGAVATAAEISKMPTTVRDVNGSGAHAALLKLLAFPAVMSSRSKQTEISGAEEEGVVVARATGGAAAMVESLRSVACMGAKPRALAVRVVWPKTSGAEELERVRRTLCMAAQVSRELGVRLEEIAIDDAASEEGEAIVAGEVRQGASGVGSFARGAGERLVVLGETPNDIEGSRFLEALHGVAAEPAVVEDLTAEKRLHDVLRTLTAARVITAARGVSEGGLMTAVCGMLLGGERAWGARLDLTPLGGARADALLFGEGGSRAIVEVTPDRVGTVISEAHLHGVPAALIGEVTPDELLDLKTRSLATAWQVGELRKVWGIAG